MVAVICWPCCGARRNTNILAVPSPDIWSVAAWLNCNTESKLAGWFFTNTNVFSQTNTLLWNCVCNCLMPLSLPQSYFGLATLPLTKSDYHTVDKLQRKMLRLIVGWIRHDGEDWSDTMSRMNRRIAFAMTIWECKPWSWQIFSKQFRVATKIFDQQSSWAAATSTWTPTNEWQQNFSTEPKRRQGRPSKRWDDNLEKFAMNYFRMSWATAARIRPEWPFFEQVYVQFCSSVWPMNPPQSL